MRSLHPAAERWLQVLAGRLKGVEAADDQVECVQRQRRKGEGVQKGCAVVGCPSQLTAHVKRPGLGGGVEFGQ